MLPSSAAIYKPTIVEIGKIHKIIFENSTQLKTIYLVAVQAEVLQNDCIGGDGILQIANLVAHVLSKLINKNIYNHNNEVETATVEQ